MTELTKTMLKKCMSYLKNILKFNWIRDLHFASIVYTLMVSFSIVRMPLCSILNAESCAVVNALVFKVVFYISYFFSLYALYLLVKFFAYVVYGIYRYVVYGIYRGVKYLLSKKKSSSKSKASVKVAPSLVISNPRTFRASRSS